MLLLGVVFEMQLIETELTLDAALIATNNDGSEELIPIKITTALISSLDGSNGVLRGLTLTEDETLKGDLEAVPTLIAVHGEVSANNGTDLTDANLLGSVDKFLHIAGTGLGVGVTAIAEEVDEDLGHAILLGSLEEGVEVGLLGVLLWCK